MDRRNQLVRTGRDHPLLRQRRQLYTIITESLALEATQDSRSFAIWLDGKNQTESSVTIKLDLKFTPVCHIHQESIYGP